MKKKILLIMFMLLLVFVSGCETSGIQTPADNLIINSIEVEELPYSRITADKFAENLVSEEYAAVYSMLAPDIKNLVMSALGVRLVWSQLTAQAGAYISHDEPKLVLSEEGADTYDYPAQFKNGKYIVSITVKEDLISGLDMREYEKTEEISLGDKYFAAIINSDYDEIYQMSNDAIRAAYDMYGGFENLWSQIIAQYGKYVSRGEASVTQIGDMTIYYFKATFELNNCLVQIVETDEKVSQFIIQPLEADTVNINKSGPVASDDLPEGVLEKDIIVNKGQKHELYGKLTYPANIEGPIPVVILVQGSGSSDMDERINEYNAPFKDIAYGLSQNGVAVLRYNKVTYAYPGDFDSNITIDEETVNDAVAAKIDLLEQSDLEFSKIYVAGHSLGGTMAPRIAAIGDYDGMIILAGTTRSLIDVMYDQAIHAIQLAYSDPELRTSYENSYKTAYEEAKSVMNLPFDQLDGKYVMGYPAKYFYSIDNPSGVEYIKDLDIPMLILQGSKDIQVFADKDFVLYKEVTKGLSDITMIKYEGLNHLFMKSTAEIPNVTEYYTPGKVDDQVIKDISNWILSH